jgi:hypothetical protein
VRSRLLFEAHKQILHPFLLCALVFGRAQQLMMGRNGSATAAEPVVTQ